MNRVFIYFTDTSVPAIQEGLDTPAGSTPATTPVGSKRPLDEIEEGGADRAAAPEDEGDQRKKQVRKEKSKGIVSDRPHSNRHNLDPRIEEESDSDIQELNVMPSRPIGPLTGPKAKRTGGKPGRKMIPLKEQTYLTPDDFTPPLVLSTTKVS